MKQIEKMEVYVKVPVEKESPEDGTPVFCTVGKLVEILSWYNGQWEEYLGDWVWKKFKGSPDHWLKPSTGYFFQTRKELEAFAMEWIETDKRKPKREQWVLLYNGNWTGVGKYAKKLDSDDPDYTKWVDETQEYITPTPTHWMLLPEPPKPPTP